MDQRHRDSARGHARGRTQTRGPAAPAVTATGQKLPAGLAVSELDRTEAGWRPLARALQQRGWLEIEARHGPIASSALAAPGSAAPAAASGLARPGQARGHRKPHLERGPGTRGRDHRRGGRPVRPFLLHGVTGSGKTEVYLRRSSAHALARGASALVLVPEIGLTPQLSSALSRPIRRRDRLLHSGLTDGERLANWLAAPRPARIVLGTRSAVFAPLPRSGLIVVDEEHEPRTSSRKAASAIRRAIWPCLRAQKAPGAGRARLGDAVARDMQTCSDRQSRARCRAAPSRRAAAPGAHRPAGARGPRRAFPDP